MDFQLHFVILRLTHISRRNSSGKHRGILKTKKEPSMHVAATASVSRTRLHSRKIQQALASCLETLEPRVLLTGSPVTNYLDVPQTPHPALPAKYASYIDPDFGTQVIRLTDASDGNDNHNAYS